MPRPRDAPPWVPNSASGCRHQSIVLVGPRGRARGYVNLQTARSGNGTVGENYEALPTTIRPHEDLRTAVSTMFRHDTQWLACVDDDGMFVGYVTLRGITHLLSETYRDG